MQIGVSRRALISGLILSGVGPVLTGCQGQGSRVFTSSDTHPKDYPTVQAVAEMGRLLNERSGGRLGIKIYAGGSLGLKRIRWKSPHLVA